MRFIYGFADRISLETRRFYIQFFPNCHLESIRQSLYETDTFQRNGVPQRLITIATV